MSSVLRTRDVFKLASDSVKGRIYIRGSHLLPFTSAFQKALEKFGWKEAALRELDIRCRWYHRWQIRHGGISDALECPTRAFLQRMEYAKGNNHA